MKQAAGTATPKAGGGAGSGKFAPITPGDYFAVAKSAESGHYVGTKDHQEYLKITPEFVLFNDKKSVINKFDITVGAVNEDDELFRPDGDIDQPALWATAGFFISALGFVDANNNVDIATFDVSLIAGQVLRITVDNDSYTGRDGKTKNKNIITGFWPLKSKDVEELNLYFDENRSGMVFLSESAADDYAELAAEIAAAGDNPDWN